MVLAGGGLGALVRYIAASAIAERFGARFPWGTLVINVTGSFAIGLLMTLFTERWQPHTNLRLLLVVGFLGGYTTFSSYEWETFQAARGGDYWIGLWNVVASNALAYAAVWFGALVAKR